MPPLRPGLLCWTPVRSLNGAEVEVQSFGHRRGLTWEELEEAPSVQALALALALPGDDTKGRVVRFDEPGTR